MKISSKSKTYNLKDVWINSNNDVIGYEQLNEDYSKNLLKYLEKRNEYIPDKLKNRVKYFENKKNKIKKLF